MKKLIICTHGLFGEEIVKSAEMIIGPIKNVTVFSLKPGINPFEYRDEIEKYLNENKDYEYLCFVDLFGGTPSNMLASLCNRPNFEVVSGLNLAMLIEVYSQFEFRSLDELKQLAFETLKNSCKDVKAELFNRMKRKEGEE